MRQKPPSILIISIVMLFYCLIPLRAQVAEQLRRTRALAEEGHAFAQNAMSTAYNTGQGVPKDLDEAVKWARLSAQQGNPEGEYLLAWAYYKGEGVPPNDAESVKWSRLAAEQGLVEAEVFLALHLQD